MLKDYLFNEDLIVVHLLGQVLVIFEDKPLTF